MGQRDRNSAAAPALVVTSIAAPNTVLRALGEGARQNGFHFFVMGDVASPPDFAIEGCDFYDIARQEDLDLRLAATLPKRHYARKNLGYLLAMRQGAPFLVETDDDNFPKPSFWGARSLKSSARRIEHQGWVNVYGYFTERLIWPRGLPLDAIRIPPPPLEEAAIVDLDCPIQQGLADDNPDVDAIFRLTLPLPVRFERPARVALAPGAWCPFNSQNTTWFREAFPLLYLPSHCNFRMTDIWRSLIAQRIAWEYGWTVLFHEPTVRQERNQHSLMDDFQDELPGYRQNRRIGEELANLSLQAAGPEAMAESLLRCYEALVRIAVVGAAELPLVEAWLVDVAAAAPPVVPRVCAGNT